MNLALSKDDLAFRDEVRTFLDAELPEELRRATRRMTSVYADVETMRHWQGILLRRGWVAPAWPQKYGGCGWPAHRRYIFAAELAAADAPPLSPMGLSMCGPVLIGHGTEAQKSFYLPRILSGEDFWCQGYSEPGAGSDLAALQMKAIDAGDHWVCTGRKMWTTHANLANRIFCLVRTAEEGRRQNGITFLLMDINVTGVEVRPITMLAGEQIQFEISFQDVAVPKSNAVGQVGQGWRVAKDLLQFERGGSAAAPGIRARLARVRMLADRCGLAQDQDFACKLAGVEIAVSALEMTERRVVAASSFGAPLDIEASMLKIGSSELSQRVTELAIEVAGIYAGPVQSADVCAGGAIVIPHTEDVGSIGPEGVAPTGPRYFNERAGSIYAGSNEIQRNIIAKGRLGL